MSVTAARKTTVVASASPTKGAPGAATVAPASDTAARIDALERRIADLEKSHAAASRRQRAEVAALGSLLAAFADAAGVSASEVAAELGISISPDKVQSEKK